ISKGCTYGIQTAIFLAEQNGSHVPVRSISEELGIPQSFLAKVVSRLARAGLVDTMRGPTGGVALSRRPDQINVREIIEAIDGSLLFTECVLGLPGCGQEKPCPLHHAWGGIREGLVTTFENIAIGDLIRAQSERSPEPEWTAN